MQPIYTSNCSPQSNYRITKQACLSSLDSNNSLVEYIADCLAIGEKRTEGLSPEFALLPKRMLPGVAGRIPDAFLVVLPLAFGHLVYIFYLFSISQKFPDRSCLEFRGCEEDLAQVRSTEKRPE